MDTKIQKDLIYPELCYKLIGILFDVYNLLGYGYKEQYYQRAIAKSLKINKVPFKEQLPAHIKFHGESLGKVFLDFLIDEKIVLEIKKTDKFSRTEINQVHGYLKATGLKLGVLAHFAKDSLRFKRILNIR